MTTGKILGKKANVKQWKKGINNIKVINNDSYTRNMRGGIRLTALN